MLKFFFVAPEYIPTGESSQTNSTIELLSYTTLVSQMAFKSVLNRVQATTALARERRTNGCNKSFIRSHRLCKETTPRGIEFSSIQYNLLRNL